MKIKLEVGKRYKNGLGRFVDITYKSQYYVGSNSAMYREDGTYIHNNEEYDIVEEVETPPNVDWSKPIEAIGPSGTVYQAEFIRALIGRDFPYLVVIKEKDTEHVRLFEEDGTSFAHPWIVRNKKVKCEAWVNVYQGGATALHDTKESADEYAGPRRVACCRIEWEETN